MTNDMGGIPESSERISAKAHVNNYRDYVAHLDMSEAAKDELLDIVWRIMGDFVDRAFGDDPVQHVNQTRSKREVRSAPVLRSRDTKPDDESLSSAFISPAAGKGRKERS